MIIIPGSYNAQTSVPGGNVQGQITTLGAILKVTERDRRPYPSDPGTPSEIWIDNSAGIGYMCKETRSTGTVWDRLDILGDYIAFGDSDPGPNIDITLGYRPGSLRYARTTQTLWICDNNTQGAAIWSVLGGGGSTISGTPTRIPFFDTTSSLSDDPELYWDNINKAVIIGASSTPSSAARLYLFSSTNNADVFIETIYNQRVKFKNTASGVQWHTSTNVFQDTPGNPRDSFNIGQSSNPALGYLEILKSGRVKIGSNIAGTLGFTDSVMLELGLTGVRGGQMLFNSLTSGSLLLKANDTTTPYTFTFPDDAGLSGEVLKTDGLGNTYWDTGGGGGTYTVDNGLTASTTTNFQLGGTLIQDTVINNVGFYSLFTGALSSGTSTGILRAENSGSSPSFRANNSGTGNAIRATSNSGIAAFIQSASSIAGYFFSTTARGIYSESYGSYGGTISRLDVSQTGVLGVLEVFRGSTGGAGLNNIGGSIDFKLAASNGGAILNNASRLISILTDANILSLTSRFSINNINNAVNEEQFYILGSGQIGFNKYGVGTFLATPAYALGVDAFGDVVEFTTSPTTGDSISPFLLMGG